MKKINHTLYLPTNVKQICQQYLLTMVLIIASFFTAFSQPFSPDIVVATDGSGDFISIQEAIDAVPDNSSDQTIIYIKVGLYDTEKLLVPGNKTNVVMIGESRDETIISYHTYNCSGGFNGMCPADDVMLWSGEVIETAATITVIGDGFRAENMTFQNTAGNVGQAQAMTIRADKVVILNCNLLGYQDTIYFWSLAKRSYFENCLIGGRTDYIYGAGTVFFQSCEIRSWGGGWITAPSTAIDQPHGFVFNECEVTFATGSPSPGDDNGLVALGRPWHNYPKVAWLYCDMTEKIHPLGWPTLWNMPYADTSADLHLYEYMNTGDGADMSGRADWVGIRALESSEAPDYTVQAVLSGTDGWDPTATPPAVTIFNWTGDGTNSSWLTAENWDPIGVPDTAEAAYLFGAETIVADGGYFAADLNLAEGAILSITNDSEVNYLAIGDATINVVDDVNLTGRLRTKDSLTISVSGSSLDLGAEILGVHSIGKNGDGTVNLGAENASFSGWWTVNDGALIANAANSLGEARGLTLSSTASLTIEVSEAFYVQTPLSVVAGSQLNLNADITLSEFYIDGVLQDIGEYSAATNPGLISGSGVVVVGRPDEFIFIGGANGNWDVAEHFQPALLPLEGETVFTEIEMETTSFVFPADIMVSGGGRIRLRGAHNATGSITFDEGTSIRYATSSTGFTLNAPLVINGDVLLGMNSAAMPAHAMTLGGSFSGSAKVTAFNQRPDTENTGTVVLGGDNSDFSGIWDLTLPSGNPNSVAVIQGISENAFGSGLIEVADHNLVALAHIKCAGDTLRVNLTDDGLIRLDENISVAFAEINGTSLADGIYDATTHPDFFTGTEALYVGVAFVSTNEISQEEIPVYFAENKIFIEGNNIQVAVFNINGQIVLTNRQQNEISLQHLPNGIYLVNYKVDGQKGTLKIFR